MQKAGCILPGSQQRVGQQRIKGIKSEGKICSAYDVGWLGEPTEDLLLLEESWGVISGDICPMAPPSVCSCDINWVVIYAGFCLCCGKGCNIAVVERTRTSFSGMSFSHPDELWERIRRLTSSFWPTSKALEIAHC